METIKRIIIILVIFFLTTSGIFRRADRIFYFSEDGVAGRSGRYPNLSLPFSSIDSVLSQSQGGDHILFNSGDEFMGTFTTSKSGTVSKPIVIGAYGDRSLGKPKLLGATEITGWSVYSDNIYQATFADTITGLTCNSSKMKAARFPNSGYALVTSVTSNTVFEADTLDGSIDMLGATWVGKTGAYTAYTSEVLAQTLKEITINSYSLGSMKVGGGFYLCDKLAFLDEAGEWFYDKATNTVYFWTPTGDSPENYTVRGSTIARGIDIRTNYITVQGIEVSEYQQYGIHIYYADNCIVKSNRLKNNDAAGVYLNWGVNETLVTDNEISGSSNSAIAVKDYGNTLTLNNIHDCALWDSLGLSGMGEGAGGTAISVIAGNNEIAYNTIENIGYNGISFHDKTNIHHNYIHNVCASKGDGGGIYGWGTSQDVSSNNGSIVAYNIIDSVQGTMDGWVRDTVGGWMYPDFGFGVYLDHYNEGVSVNNNTIIDVSKASVFLHENANNTVSYNTSIGNQVGLQIMEDYGSHTYSNNINYNSSSDSLNYLCKAVAITNEHTYGNNTYISHYRSGDLFNYVFGWTAADSDIYTPAEWFASGKDSGSTVDLSVFDVNESDTIIYNATSVSKTFDLTDAKYTDINGDIKTTATLKPFTSKIFTVEEYTD
jgi:parallel beta-helix repeat protein